MSQSGTPRFESSASSPGGREAAPLRRHPADVARPPSAERKASLRPNQEDGERRLEDQDEQARSAVESAADALLQRLRLRARAAKPPAREGEEEDDSIDNQDCSYEVPDAPVSPRELPPPLTVTQLRVSGRVLHDTAMITTEVRQLEHSFISNEGYDEAISPLSPPLHPLVYRPPDRRSPDSLQTRADWHMAFMARANQVRLPGEQIDLPDFADGTSSDMSSHDQVNDYLCDSAVSDGELMLSRRATGQGSESDAFAPSDDEQANEFDNADEEPEIARHGLRRSNLSTASLSSRDINTSKASALKNAMQRNLVRLGFDHDLSRAALDAGIREIEQYDSDCELAYVDIFITLVKLVCDAHHDITPPPSIPAVEGAHETRTYFGACSPRVPFKWPVFDMAQFEFGNARAGTCFESVCVLINLPKVTVDRTEELMEILSSCLFCMIGDPIQVLIPSISGTGRTKGHAFLEFDDPSMAHACTAAVDGLTWGRGPYGRIRAKLFRQYQVKSPVPPGEMESSTIPPLGRDDMPRHQRISHPQAGNFRQFLPPYAGVASDAELLRESRELSREDLNASGASNSASWNTDSQASIGFEGEGRRSPLYQLNFTSNGHSLHHSLSSLEELALHQSREDGTMHLGELRLSSDEEDDDGECSTTESDLELAEAILNRANVDTSTSPSSVRRLQSLQHSLRQEPMLPIPRFIPNATSVSMTASPASPARPIPSGVDIEGPWKAYCEELIQRNREMQDQVAYARRRIAALSHNNQKLHLLVDRMERDRDGLMFENDLLQTQLHGYEDHERQQEALMKELSALRRRMKRRDQRIERNLLESELIENASGGVAVDLEGGVMTLDELEEQLIQNIISSRRLTDLKEWEQMLEGSLVRVRSIKEEIALELQKKVAQQADDQVQDHKLCVVCLSNEKSILCLPCRHLCLCQECSQHAELDKCPICRLVVENMLLVYA